MSKPKKTIQQTLKDAGFANITPTHQGFTATHAKYFDKAHANAVQALDKRAACRRVNSTYVTALIVTPAKVQQQETPAQEPAENE